jgi:hypothetical protein
MPRTHRRFLLGLLIAFTLLGAGFLTRVSIRHYSLSVQPLSLKKVGADESTNNVLSFESAGATSAHDSTQAATEADGRVRASKGEEYGRLPLSFEANRGQVDGKVKYFSHGSGYSLYLTSTEAVLALTRPETGRVSRAQGVESGPTVKVDTNACADVLRMRLVNANPSAGVKGVDEQPSKSNYFIGSDPAKWRTDVPQYARVRYSDVYPGVNLVYYGNQRQLEYDLEVAPGTDPGSIKMAFDGADEMSLDADGSLLLRAGGGELRQHKPVAYQVLDGERREVAARYSMKNEREVGFEVSEYDRSSPLVIDPVLSYSTYLGGVYNDWGMGIAVDSLGNAYITGVTSSIDFPLVNPLPSGRPQGAAYDFVFVSKLNAAGSALVYSTYLGGTTREIAHSIAVDKAGNAYITGFVSSPDFPVVNAYQPNLRGSDAFVTKLNPTGSALIYSTYLGGSADEEGYSIAVDASGSAYVTGRTVSGDFPTVNPAQAHYGGNACSVNNPCQDTFITKFNPSGSALVYSTFLGGERNDFGYGIAADSQGNAYVTGFTASVNFPTTANVLQPEYSDKGTNSEEHDAFVTKMSPSGSFVYSTYLGGPRGSDDGEAIAVDAAGNAYVAGGTSSGEFPIVNAFQPAIAPGGNGAGSQASDVFISKLNASGTALLYSTYLGGGGNESAKAIALDAAGNAYLTGYTSSFNFPTLNPFQPISNLSAYSSNAFVTKLNPTGNALVYSSHLGGSDTDQGQGIAVDSSGSVYVTGATYSNDFPTANAFDATIGGTFWPDAFVTKIANEAQPVSLSISAVQPDRGGNTGAVSVTVHGSGFVNGAKFRLVHAGQPDIASLFAVISRNGTVARSRFNLNGQAQGVRDVVVTNPDGSTFTLPGAFTVEAGGQSHVWVDIIGRANIRPGLPQRYYILYGNSGNAEAYGVPLFIRGIPKDAKVELGFNVKTPPQVPGHRPIDYNQMPVIIENAVEKIIPLYLPVIRVDESGALEITINASPTSNFELQAYTWRPQYTPNPAQYAPPCQEGKSPQAARDAAASGLSPASVEGEVGGCVHSLVGEVFSVAGVVGIPVECITSSVLSVTDIIYTASETTDCGGGFNDPYSFSQLNLGIEGTVAECIGAEFPGRIIAGVQTVLGIKDIADTCVDLGVKLFVRLVFGADPNDKIGAQGVGLERYVSGQEPLRYAIYFENKPDATGPAQEVVVTDQLDPAKLDFETFNLGPIFFGVDKKVIPPPGLSEYSADVDLRPQQNIIAHVEARLDKTTGLVTWRFTSLNPATGLPTDDPFAGFLPPNKNAPEGEAQVLFTVRARKTVATGMEIRNKARIVFDTNAPIDTPEWLNTIDNSKPVSHVLSLAATQDSVIFNLNWSGTDAGSGVRRYTIFVSEDSSPFNAWLSNTTAASGTFIGQPGRTYSFYSVAQDQTGNQENAKTSAEAVTTTTSSISNSIDDTRFFVRQQYLDFLNREPDTGGLGYWTNEITKCGADTKCIHDRRVGTADAFFFEQEFQQTGAYIYRIYRAALGRRPAFSEFIADRGSVVAGPGLDQSKTAYALSFVQRDAFLNLYARTQSADVFVDTLLNSIKQNSGVDLSSQRSTMVSLYDGTDSGRAAIIKQIADSQLFIDREYNRSFVLMEYFGYLRRDPDEGGYGFWLGQVNKYPLRNVGIQHAMACSFITSAEYQLRFGSQVTHTNRECPQ